MSIRQPIRTALSIFAALVLIVAATTGCGRDAARTGRPRVALVLKTLNNPFFIDMQKGAEEAARRLDVDLTVQAAERETDVEKQMQIIENLVQTGVNAMATASEVNNSAFVMS